MSMPNDSEQKEILRWEDERHGVTTSAKIKAITTKMIAEAQDHILKQVAPIQEKVEEHDGKIREQDGFIAKVRRAFGGVVKG